MSETNATPLAVQMGSGAQELIELLDHCDAALTAAGAELWDIRRDLAIACNQRAQRCRLVVKELRSAEVSIAPIACPPEASEVITDHFWELTRPPNTEASDGRKGTQ